MFRFCIKNIFLAVKKVRKSLKCAAFILDPLCFFPKINVRKFENIHAFFLFLYLGAQRVRYAHPRQNIGIK